MMARILVLGMVAGVAVLAQGLEVRGTYASPNSFWKAGGRLDEWGVNAIFVHSGSITKEMMERAAREGAKVYAEFATLNGKGYVEAHPEAWPVDETGARAPAATWFLGACPTDAGFRAYRLKQLDELLERHAVAGVWMDYLHWHAQFEDPKPVLPETCFNDSCVRAFAARTGVRVPDGTAAERARFILSKHDAQWRAWRAEVLLEWARMFRKAMNAKRPGLLLGNYQCAWTDDEYGGARLRTLGLDVKAMAELVDVMSPMVYHGRKQRSVEWVGEAVEWLSRTVPRVRIWPIVEAHGDAAEFRRALELGRSGRASGVMMFTIGRVAEDPSKMEVLKELYRRWSRGSTID